MYDEILRVESGNTPGFTTGNSVCLRPGSSRSYVEVIGPSGKVFADVYGDSVPEALDRAATLLAMLEDAYRRGFNP